VTAAILPAERGVGPEMFGGRARTRPVTAAALRWLALLLIATAFTACRGTLPVSEPAPAEQVFDQDAWRADYLALRRHLDAAYANLDFASGQLDLRALDARAQTEISAAQSAAEARAALVGFIEAFHDPHLRVAEESSGPPVEVSADLAADAACAALGYGRERPGAFSWGTAPGFAPLPGRAFLNGLLRVGGRRVGVIRFGAFGADRYLDLCLEEWRPEPGRCEAGCKRALRKRVEAALVAEGNAAIDRLVAAGAEALVIDVTGNGGGNSWVDLIARRFPGRDAPCPRSAIVKHPHAEALVRHELEATAAELTRLSTDARLLARRARLERLLAAVQVPCDRSALWKGEGLSCSSLADQTDEEAICALPAAAGGIELPALLLIDGRTASAAEALVARLKDYGKARTIGVRSMGAGCGMTAGGIPITLPHSGLTVELPDCVRYRRDGTNERAGIEADFALPPPGVEGWRAAELLGALAEALAALAH
jgi:hypothetical protein